MRPKKLWIAVVVGIALVALLVALQLVDDASSAKSTRSADRSVPVKGIRATR